MFSLALNECIQFAREQDSKVYGCFLDCKQAFNRVWNDGLFYKLSHYLKAPVLSCVLAMYKDSCSKIRYNERFSEPVSVLQGTRQGGISSPTFYLLYINDLIQELENSGYGLCIAGKSCSCICYEYSCRWRYTYDPIKCFVVVSNEPKRYYNIQHRYWTLGSNSILETEDYTHLGINSNKYSNQLSSIESSSRKLRSTLTCLVNVGICYNGLNPVTSYIKSINVVLCLEPYTVAKSDKSYILI